MIAVVIDTEDRTDLARDLTITGNVNEQVDTADFIIEKAPGDTFVPAVNSEVVITRDGERIFAGTIASVSDQLIGSNVLEYRVNVLDYTFDLQRKLVTERYEDTTVQSIIEALVAKYDSSFTTANVQAQITVSSVAFNRIPLNECLRKLADLVNYQWYVDYRKDIHFFALNEESAPFEATEGNYLPSSLSITKDITQLRNIVTVQGGDEPDAPRTVRLAGNGETAEFGTELKFATIPTVTVNGVQQTIATDFLNDDADFQCLWNFNEKYVRFTAGNIPSKPTLPEETNIEITGNPLFPIVVNVPEPTSIEVFGEWEFALTDTDIGTQEQAIERAIAELRAYSGSIDEGSFQTYRAGLRAGQTIRIVDGLRGLNEEFVIQRIQYRWLSSDSTFDAVWTVTVATQKLIGLLSVLQKLLLAEDVSVDERLTLVQFLRIAQDDLTTSDTMNGITTQTGPYAVGTAVVGFSKMN